MTPWKRLLFYLVLNVIVAAVTTLLVLSWWDRTHHITLPPSNAPTLVQKTGQPVAAAGTSKPAAATALPANQPVIEIKNVFGVGDLQNEVVMIKRIGDGEISMSKWKLQGEDKHEYVFPDLVLNKNGAVQVYSRAGVDTVIELYWGLNAPVWKSGEQVTLVDPQGVVRATYTIP